MTETTPNFVNLGQATQVPENTTKVFPLNGKRVLVANVDGVFYAIDDRCTHDNGPLGEGELCGSEVECPRHGARFDLRTGKALCLPAVGAVSTYKIDIREGDLYVGLPENV
ncbi:MAG: non-heme iron oxygenase ferredoxin subunit [Candidatus Obscuribacterales bacterium]|nr:non-heme iron oxygenase ferredoxin subunit [Candidatus Obscuribacterales bacterium]